MKKILLIFIFILIPCFAHSQENDTDITQYEKSPDNYTFKQYGVRVVGGFGFKYMFPTGTDLSHLEFVNFGFGVGTDIIKYILSPGIYLDLDIGTDWF